MRRASIVSYRIGNREKRHESLLWLPQHGHVPSRWDPVKLYHLSGNKVIFYVFILLSAICPCVHTCQYRLQDRTIISPIMAKVFQRIQLQSRFKAYMDFGFDSRDPYTFMFCRIYVSTKRARVNRNRKNFSPETGISITPTSYFTTIYTYIDIICARRFKK